VIQNFTRKAIKMKIQINPTRRNVRLAKKQETTKETFEQIGVCSEKAAKMLDISTQTLWKLTRDGRLPKHVRTGNKIIYLVDGLREFLAPAKDKDASNQEKETSGEQT
jgi:predicted DNA-binding transcriptional regulator AlpA